MKYAFLFHFFIGFMMIADLNDSSKDISRQVAGFSFFNKMKSSHTALFVGLSFLQLFLFLLRSIKGKVIKKMLRLCKHRKVDTALSSDFYQEIDYISLQNEL